MPDPQTFHRRRLFPFLPFTVGGDRELWRGRTVALLLTLAIHALLLLFVLWQRGYIEPRKEDNRLVTFSLSPDPAKKESGDKSKAKEEETARDAAKSPEPPKDKPVPVEVKPVPLPEQSAPSFIQLSPQDFAASDLAKLGARGGKPATGGGGDSVAAAGPGEGPGGVQLFEAEWYRRPTDMELSGYIPANAPTNGWGLVACRTIENYHVENCQTLGESPMGSGLARAVRQAAWQFLVRPPRVNGKPQVGAWVRIRIDYSQRTVNVSE
ncbi:MAG: hypothetical protein ABW184_17895 [Sphingobium sp.]